jgi:multicomponent Na+:H+ antiporter subunit D
VLIRVFLGVFQPSFAFDHIPLLPTICWLAAGGIIFGSVLAIAQLALRRMLAYSSVSQIAYVGLGLGMANPFGLVGALLHVANHAIMKACLFFVAGSLRYRTGSVEISNLAGMGRKMPWTFAAFTVAALSMIGIPPAAGFFSKWYLLLGALEARNGGFVAVILISSLLNAAYFFRVLENLYAIPGRKQDDSPPAEAPASMLVPTLFMAVGVIVLGLFNSLIVSRVLEPVANGLYQR